MLDRTKINPMTVDEYLQQEETASGRHEFVDGYAFAMTGAADAHNVICTNLITILRTRLRGTGCRAYVNDMKVKTESPTSFYYPDIMVTCEPYEPKSMYKQSPVLLIEVLSPSTKQVDRREKLLAYKRVPTVREYAIVYSDRQRIELHRRIVNQEWELFTLGQADTLTLTSIPGAALDIPLSSVYEDTDLPTFVREDEEDYVVS